MTLLVAAGFVTCIPGCNLIETRPDATGSTGGSSNTPTSSGGVKGSGGTTSSGGVTSSGGLTTSSSGSSSGGSGGGPSSGGSTARGGSGGTAGSGSTTASGGSAASGGTIASGGTTARGGSGGTAGSGGTTASTVVSTSTCTDDPAPGQPQTCAEWLSYGMCSQSWFATYCNRTCGRCSGGGVGGAGGLAGSGGSTARGGSGGTAGSSGVVGTGGVIGTGGVKTGGTTGAGGSTTPGSTNPQISGTSGWASRYWDCCKPSCGWSANSNPPVPSCDKGGSTRISVDQKNGCEGGGSAFECYDFSPWFDSGTNMSYGFAAYNGVACGTCFELQFTGNGNSGPNAGAAAIKGQQMIVQIINIGGIAANQFDLLIPGGGVGAMNGCATQWGGSADLGVQYGGLLSECGGDATCMKGKCSSVFGSISSTLKAGCDWFTGWFSSADNPQLVYKQVSCPSQLSNKTGLSK
jgi:hypothetical protein